MNKKVKDYVEGDHVESYLMIASSTKGVTNYGSPYLTLDLQDGTKSIVAKFWDVKPEIEKLLEVGKVFQFELEIIKYKNNLQAKVLKVLPVSQNEINIEDFTFKSPVSVDDLRVEVQNAVNSIENENIMKIVNKFLNKYQSEFYQYPAASKIHHNFIGGLATHVVGMLKMGQAACDIYPQLNRDYLLGGIILHDIGKIVELNSPVLTEYTTEGKLLGHISIMDAMLFKTAIELGIQDSEEVMVLRHMILSHHGEYEFGSPVKPMTKEALVLTYLDNIDAKLNVVTKALEETEEGEFTQKLFALDNLSFYKTK